MWSHPTSTSKKAHWFDGPGAISACRKYINAVPGLMTPAFDSEARCLTCEKKKKEAK